jgi:four helix bundle protein
MKKDAFRGFRDLRAYQLSYQLALEIHDLSKGFPREEKYALIDQIRKSPRSIPTNIAEAWKKRR